MLKKGPTNIILKAMVATNEMDEAKGTDTRRRKAARVAFVCYRLAFAVSLVVLSTLATSVRYEYHDETTELLLSATQDRKESRRNLESKPESEERVLPIDPVQFLPFRQLDQKDGFSASWLQTREDFLSMPFEKIRTCEDAAFKAYHGGRRKKMRMTVDWLDWSVEHMSKWWKYSDWESDPDAIAYNKITEQFTEYLDNARNFPIEDPLFKETIAVIPFQAYRHSKIPEMGRNLTIISLSATIESLRRVGFGRVTVGILTEEEFDIVQDSFSFLLQRVERGIYHDPRNIVTQVGHMELGCAVIPKEVTVSTVVRKNMPRGALYELRDAMLLSQQENLDPVQKRLMESWLGRKHHPTYFKYVYLTEADTILQTRQSKIQALKKELDKGGILLPHRLQPIQHESDLKGANERYFVSERFKNVTELDPLTDACCDEQAGPEFKPGRHPFIEHCGIFWYICNMGQFYKGLQPDEERHVRLASYDFIRLKGGTEIVSVAGSEHARRCFPKRNSTCELRTD